ncbi:MAG: hypothetical protein ACI9QR_001408 [Flavobacteriaceae bacterium]|jgi:hypothetical protein
MIRILLLATSLLLSLSNFAQHRTEVDDDGERLTERTDENGLKQGEFVFFSKSNQIIRQETYLDGSLISRKCLVNNVLMDGTVYKVKSITADSEVLSGEIIFSLDGSYETYYYNENTVFKNQELEILLRKEYSNAKNLILQF